MPTTIDKHTPLYSNAKKNNEDSLGCSIPLWLLVFSVTLSLVVTSYFTLWHNDHHEINRNLELALVAKEMENKLLKEQVGELKLRERHHIKKERILEGTLTSAERKELADDYDRLRKEYFRDIQDFEYGSVELDGVFSSTTTDEYKHLHNDAIQGY